jgi:hypothetical protein
LTQSGHRGAERDLHIDFRFAGASERYQPRAQELLALQPDVVVASTTPVAVIMQQQTLVSVESAAMNFAHLFSMSLLPLSTAWMAASKLAPQPVAFYAAVFFLVNATYIALIWELIDRTPVEVSTTVRKIMYVRPITTLCLFGLAALVALNYPLAGLGICICCLIGYLKPDPPEAAKQVRT